LGETKRQLSGGQNRIRAHCAQVAVLVSLSLIRLADFFGPKPN
jgi:hypothetical protein